MPKASEEGKNDGERTDQGVLAFPWHAPGKKELLLLFCQMDTVLNWPIILTDQYISQTSSEMLAFAVGGNKYRSTTGQGTENETAVCGVIYGMSSSHSLHLRFNNHCWRKGRKTVRARGGGGKWRQGIQKTQRDSELTAIMTAFTRPVQENRAWRNPNMERGDTCWLGMERNKELEGVGALWIWLKHIVWNSQRTTENN